LARRGRSPNTVRAYRADLAAFTRFHTGPPQTITAKTHIRQSPAAITCRSLTLTSACITGDDWMWGRLTDGERHSGLQLLYVSPGAWPTGRKRGYARSLTVPGGVVMGAHAIQLAGVHHLKLPVRDLARTEEWYQRVLGYERAAEFVEDGILMGIGMFHSAGGPGLAFRLDPERAAAAAGFDYFAIGVPTFDEMHALAVRLDSLGQSHGGVHRASTGWILPYLHDPDGHEVRFYTIEQHTFREPDRPKRVDDAGDVLDEAKRTAAGGPRTAAP